MNDDLVERVARAIAETQDDRWDNPALFMVDANDTAESGREAYCDMARAAIAIALEEAAKVLKEKTTEHRAEAKRLLGTIDTSDEKQVYLVCCQEARADGYQGAEAAIRGMIKD
jgi:hypothetical protein